MKLTKDDFMVEHLAESITMIECNPKIRDQILKNQATVEGLKKRIEEEQYELDHDFGWGKADYYLIEQLQKILEGKE